MTLTGLIGNQPVQSSNQPRASINWIVLDEQFRYVSGGFDMVGTDVNGTGAYKVHDLTTIPAISIPKNGYIYVYCSNESQYNVFFDNLQVFHNRGSVIEETHYYPWGLVMTGICGKALNFEVNNKNLFNDGCELQSNEFSDYVGLDLYDATNRFYDPQIGRFQQIDPMASYSENWTLYAYVMNNPMLYNDPLGLDTTSTTSGKISPKPNPQVGDVLKIINPDGSVSYYNYDPKNSNANAQGYVGAGIESAEEKEVVVGKMPRKISPVKIRVDFKELISDYEKWEDANVVNISDAKTLENGIGSAPIAIIRQIIKGWSKATFKSVSASIRYHYAKHVTSKGIKKTLEEFTEDGVNFFKNNKQLGKQVTLKSGQPGIYIKTKGGPGGYFTPNGEIITFWYK